ncbi:antibiotic biosynthesis monooxygenase [Paenibacillus sp. SC116]|uniref:putative quinol monooxygenase n=1 Tax=Paenibacillus sp. SC116 TaxID=2968986 RepID=UPI00215AD146|nr:antibiotic biosynthesis monooxygenase [Paenibacillus sp. SC116]MCR8845299.1 antibiotic biosynthesis monooxygenase [Paenibacillus sp. SC116]
MFVRVVTFKSKAGKEERVRKLGRETLVPINQEAGSVHVYFLEPHADNDLFGVVSIWREQETLETMKNSEQYRELIQELAPLVESLIDTVYVSD